MITFEYAFVSHRSDIYILIADNLQNAFGFEHTSWHTEKHFGGHKNIEGFNLHPMVKSTAAVDGLCKTIAKEANIPPTTAIEMD